MSHQRSHLLRRLRTYAALVLLPAQLAACATWANASLSDLKPEPVNRVRFYPADTPQDRVELREAELIGDSLVGFEFEREHPAPLRRSFASHQLYSLQRRVGSEGGGAFVATAGIVGGLVLMAVIGASLEWRDPDEN